MLHGWRFRMPIWVAVAVVVVAYLVRGVLRGLDFRLDIPADLVALALFTVVLALVIYIRRALGDSPEDDAAGRSPEDDSRDTK